MANTFYLWIFFALLSTKGVLSRISERRLQTVSSETVVNTVTTENQDMPWGVKLSEGGFVICYLSGIS